MQTFLPYGADFAANAEVLDRQRLGKQRVETMQIYNAAIKGEGGWSNHPATIMWSQNLGALIVYGMHICYEWQQRGYKDTMLGRFRIMFDLHAEQGGTFDLPWWFSGTVGSMLAYSHRSNLMRKAPMLYPWDEVPDNVPYVWPHPDGTFHYG